MQYMHSEITYSQKTERYIDWLQDNLDLARALGHPDPVVRKLTDISKDASIGYLPANWVSLVHCIAHEARI